MEQEKSNKQRKKILLEPQKMLYLYIYLILKFTDGQSIVKHPTTMKALVPSREDTRWQLMINHQTL